MPDSDLLPGGKPTRAVFMGTPSFAIPVLDALLGSPRVSVEAVYTPPDRPRGRGRAPEIPPVKAHALNHCLNVCQPASLRPPEVGAELQSTAPDVIVVAAYGRFLPASILAIPHHGCLNLHPSLLPKYRGPSPVPSTLLAEETSTGVTLMLLDEGMDTGPIIAQSEYPLSGNETSETLTEDLFRQGADMLLECLAPWCSGTLPARPQDDSLATVTSKLEREDGLADWNLAAAQIAVRHRAYTPWPGLFSHWDGKVVKFLDAVALPGEVGAGVGPGTVVTTPGEETPLAVSTGQGLLGLKRLQLEGRRAVSGVEFLRGYPGIIGARLE